MAIAVVGLWGSLAPELAASGEGVEKLEKRGW